MRSALRSVPGLLVLALLAGPALAGLTVSEVKRTLKSGDQGAVTSALSEIEGQLDADLVKAIVDAAPRLKSLGIYDALIATLVTARGEALDELVKAYERQRRPDLRFLLVDALGKIPELAAEGVLLDALQAEDETVAVLAARQLGRRGTASAVVALIPILKVFEGDPRRIRLVREVNGALGALTGQDLTVADDWKNYWDAHKAEFQTPAQPSGDEAGSQTRDRNAIDRMRRERPSDLRTMERMREDDVLVVRAKMDAVERVLGALNVRHKEIDQAEFESSTQLDPTRQVLVLNCPGVRQEARYKDATIQKIREFVARGGYLFTSDLHMGATLAKAFPDVIRRRGVTSNGATQTITIAPHQQATSHPLMRDVFPLNSTWTTHQFTWKLFQTCEIAEPNAAIIDLVTSQDLTSLGPTNVVAFTFNYPPTAASGRPPRVATGGGRGRRPQGGVVLHVLSHFKLQENDDGDGFALQQILLNLIVDKQDRRRAELAGAD